MKFSTRFKIFLLILFSLNNVIESLANELLYEKSFEYRCKLFGCHYFRPTTDDEKYFDSIGSFTNSKPNGYIARFSFYIAEPDPGNAIIVLSSQNTTNYDSSNAYIFKITGLGRTLQIKKGEYSLIYKYNDRAEILEAVLKVLIEITEVGYLRVYFDDNPEPTVTVFDLNPIDVKFISLQQHYKPIQYFFHCPSDANEIPVVVPNATSAPFDDNDLSSAPIHVLAEKCKVQECWDRSSTNVVPFENFTNSQPRGYLFRLPFYMFEQTRILLSMYYSCAYRIEINRKAQTVALYRRYWDPEKHVQQRSLPYLEGAQVKVLVQISEAALIEVYLEDLYMPVLSYHDRDKLYPDKIQFNCESRTWYFYECPDFGRSLEDHALLDTFKSTTQDRKAKCTSLENLDNAFPEKLNISAVGNVIEDGYIIRLPIYVQAVADVVILLTTDGVENKRETYEFNIGGDDNKITTIRKNKQVLATVEVADILDRFRPVKFVIEITNAGIIRIFTEHNRWVPLLEAEDKSLINKLSYISFYAYDQNALFFYECTA